MSDTDLLWNDVRRSPTTVERERCILEFNKEQSAKKEYEEHKNSRYSRLFSERYAYRKLVTDAIVRQLIWKNVDLSEIKEANAKYISFLLNGLDKVTGFYDRIPFLIREELIWREWNETERLSATLLFETAQNATHLAELNKTPQTINDEKEKWRLFYFYVSELRRKRVRIPKFDDERLHYFAGEGLKYMLIPRIRLTMKDSLLDVPELILLRQLRESYILQSNLAMSIDGMIEIKLKNVQTSEQGSYNALKSFWQGFKTSLESTHAKRITDLEIDIRNKKLPFKSEIMTIQTIYSSFASEFQNLPLELKKSSPPAPPAPVVLTHRAKTQQGSDVRHGSDVISQLPQNSPP